MTNGADTKTTTMISVITPTRDRVGYLAEAIASVRASVMAGCDAGFEHLVHDVGSVDGTAELLRREAGDRLRVLTSPTPVRASIARNRLIEIAGGGWIAPLDDDDILLQRALFHYAAAIARDSGVRWFIAGFLHVDSELRYLPGEDYYPWRFNTPTDMLRAIFRAECFVQGNTCFSKRLFDEVGGYDEEVTMAEDLELVTRFLLAGAMPVTCDHVGHLHRFHGGNVSTGSNAEKHRADLTAIYTKHADRLQALGVEAP